MNLISSWPIELVVKALGEQDVAQLVMGQSPPSSTYNEDKLGLPFFQGKTDFGYLYPTPRIWCSTPLRIGEPGDILMSVRAPVGDVNLANEKCALGRGVAAIRSGKDMNGIFLFYALQFSKPQLVAASSGAIFESINKAALQDIKLSLPSKAEQEKIAAVLWKVQQAIATQDRLIKLSRELKQSAMQRLFTRGLRGEALKETAIGLVPNSWEVKRLDTCCDVFSPSFSYTDLLNLDDVAAEDLTSVHGIKVSDMNLPGNELEIVSANLIKEISCSFAEKKMVPPKAVVFPKRGAAIATNKKRLTTTWTVLDPNLIGVRPKIGFNHLYLFYWFERFDLRSITESGPTPQLNKKDLFPLLIPMPMDEEEQIEIANALATIDKNITHHQKKRTALNDLFQTLLHKLMTAEIRVADLDIDISEVTSRPLQGAQA